MVNKRFEKIYKLTILFEKFFSTGNTGVIFAVLIANAFEIRIGSLEHCRRTTSGEYADFITNVGSLGIAQNGIAAQSFLVRSNFFSQFRPPRVSGFRIIGIIYLICKHSPINANASNLVEIRLTKKFHGAS